MFWVEYTRVFSATSVNEFQSCASQVTELGVKNLPRAGTDLVALSVKCILILCFTEMF
jgi:hypothetical protein